MLELTMLNESLNLTFNENLSNDVTFQQDVSRETVKNLTLIFVMVLTPAIAVVGSIGNIICLYVLFQQRMRNPTNFLLAALAFSDLLFLIFSFFFAFTFIYKSQNPIKGENFRRITYPYIGAYLSIVPGRITTWLTALLSFERFIAVHFPMRVRELCRKQYTCIAILVVYVVTFLAFIPFPLKYQIISSPNSSLVILTKTPLGNNANFCAIYGTLLNVLLRFIPIILLIILNIFIINAIKKTWSLRRELSKNSSNGNSYEQTKITKMLLMVSFVFLICILPGALNSIASKIYPKYSKLGAKKNLFLSISCVTYFLETVNSSVNFIIYMVFSAKFRRTYREHFCCKSPTQVHNSKSREIIRFSACRRNESQSSSSETPYDWTRLSSLLTTRTVQKRDHPIGLSEKQSSLCCENLRPKSHRSRLEQQAERFN